MIVNEIQAKALARKEERDKRRLERQYDRKEAPAFQNGLTRLWGLRRRAEKKGIPFDLSQEWIASKLALVACDATSIPFSGNPHDPFSKSFDRKDSSKGYTMDNCWAVCWIYNRCKLDGAHEEVMAMARALVDLEERGPGTGNVVHLQHA